MINLMNKDIFIPDGYDEVYIEYDGVSIKYHLKKYKHECTCKKPKDSVTWNGEKVELR